MTIIYLSFPCLTRESIRDIRVKPEYDREEAEDDIKEAALKRDSSSSVIPVLLFFPVMFGLAPDIQP